ncbi:HvfB family MNIO-type RiPP peptide maturase [Aquipseudomonas ullengensis]
MPSFVSGAGLGLRRGLLAALQDSAVGQVDFLEVAPENWIGIGGRFGRQLRALTERLPFLCHGLSLNLGGFAPLDMNLLRAIKAFLDAHGIRGYSEHLSACADDGQLYDLMPLPFCEASVQRIAQRIRTVQDVLERPLIIENVSAYARLPGEMDEADFVNAVLAEGDCRLLLDINNVYVNSHNFAFDPHAYIAAMPGERIAYLHMAGHAQHSAELKVDTHGAPVCDPVWALLEHAYALHGVRPTLLERDFNFPPVSELYAEVAQIRALQRQRGHD